MVTDKKESKSKEPETAESINADFDEKVRAAQSDHDKAIADLEEKRAKSLGGLS